VDGWFAIETVFAVGLQWIGFNKAGDACVERSRRFLFFGFSGEFFCFLNRVKNTHRDIQGCFVGCVCLLVFFDHLSDGLKMKLLLGMTPFSDVGIFCDIHGDVWLLSVVI